MAETTLQLVEFSFFVVFALLGIVLATRLKVPYVVGLLVFGMIAGPNVLALVKSQQLISTFSELGAILLLFTVGIEFSISRMLRSGFRAILVTFFKMSILFFFGYELALYFGLDLASAMYVGAMVSITSTAIMYKIAGEKGTAKDPLMPLLFSMLIVEDLVAVAALTFFTSLGASGAPTQEDKVFSIFISLALLGAFYLFARRHASGAIVRLTSKFNEEALIFVAFTLCFVMSFAADFFGLSPTIGAFLAGSIIAALPNARSIQRTIHPLLLTFAAFFFLALGMQIDPAAIWGHLGFAAALSLVFIAVCFASEFLLLYSTGTKAKGALFGASSMVVLGEFSLIIATVAKGENAHILLSVGSFGVVATALVSSFLLDRQERLAGIGRRLVPARAIATGSAFAAYFSGLVKDFSPNGHFWRVSTVCWGCVARKLAVVAALLLAMWIARAGVAAAGVSSVNVKVAIFILGGAPVLYYLVLILRDIRPVLDALSHAIARHRRSAKDESIILRDIGFATFFLLLALALPDAQEFFQLPSFFSLGDEISFMVAFAFIWDLAQHAGRLVKKRKGRAIA
ncbi:MAG: cation:proton antiporter [Candidatus Micrarchaeota archaeon]|nr:cation:proton antiporter [Candidatus Micrarchaeota archaeon]